MAILEGNKLCANPTILDIRLKKQAFGVESNAEMVEKNVIDELKLLLNKTEAEKESSILIVDDTNNNNVSTTIEPTLWSSFDSKVSQKNQKYQDLQPLFK